ncbi:uncharacterized protein LOC127160178 [Labeo rohita]|uniref:uncharacterized protein LOC127160178 n=1 Tax=Labeo rohita TaxID=84645 RepID=UPI0021E2C73C|nr:uncharacterized protein LOC127160178 [Labeo rohita]
MKFPESLHPSSGNLGPPDGKCDCRKDIGSDAEWLDINLGLFSKVANYTDLKELNISGLAALESLSPDQKAELLLDPSTGAIENVTVVKEVLSSILKSRDEEQLEKFFETFVEVSKEENITYITNAGVRDAILNLTLTALAPKFPLFQTSDYELWFQINLVVLLASFRPSVLVVIPANLTCDSYDAVLKGLENALAVLPSGIGVELKSSIGELRQSAPEGCTPPRPVGVCEETVVDEVRLCESVNRDGLGSQVPSSDRLCDFGISEYACSSVASSLSSGDLVTLLTCKQPNSTTGAEAWKLFFQKVAGVLEVALSAYSSTNLSDRQPEPHVLDAIGEVKVNNFSATQLTDVSFVAHWFQGRLRPFLPAASTYQIERPGERFGKVLPSGIGVELKSSIGESDSQHQAARLLALSVSEETVVDEVRLCESVNRDGLGSQVPSWDRLCDFGISEYACSSVASSHLGAYLCDWQQPNRATSRTRGSFSGESSGVLEVALSAYSSTNLSDRSLAPRSRCIGEVKLNNFSATQLRMSASVHWFQGRLRPFLPAASKKTSPALAPRTSVGRNQVV